MPAQGWLSGPLRHTTPALVPDALRSLVVQVAQRVGVERIGSL